MKRIVQYKLNFESKWLTASSVLMGAAFFVQALYFLGVTALQGMGAGRLLLYMVFPMLLEALWCVLMRGIRLNTPAVYGILGAGVCVLLLVQCFFYGSVLRTVLGVAAYLIAAFALLAIIYGFVSCPLLGTAVFGTIALVRVLVFDTGRYLAARDWSGFLQELPALCLLGAIACLFGGITAVVPREK